MKSWFQVALLALGLCSATALAGPDSFDMGSGRDGPLTVTAAGTVINRHARVTGPIAPGDNVLLVAGTEGFGAGDLVMVLQVTGLVPEPRPGAGPIELTHDPVGRWELARLEAVGDGTLTLRAPLVHSYAAQVTQVIRIPEYTDVHIQRDASLRAVPWNGGTGGVLAFLATGTVHNDGELRATGAGFRGGRHVTEVSDPRACMGMALAVRPGAQKGEGVAVTQYGPMKIGRESVSNGGGGGVCPRAGGGGGGNGGPGGRGGSADMGEGVRNSGGQGGAKLVHSMLDHLSLGGGGGSGHGEDWSGPDGGAGGGIIFVHASRLSGRGSIVADGEAGGSASMGGGSGGGAGGSIYLRVTGSAECGIVSARGGTGGDTAGSFMESGGPGGGGGGGRVMLLAGSSADCLLSSDAGLAGASPNPHVLLATGSGQGAQPRREELALHSGLVLHSFAEASATVLAPPVVSEPVNDSYVNTIPKLVIKGTAKGASKVSVVIRHIDDGLLMSKTVSVGLLPPYSWDWEIPQPPPDDAADIRLLLDENQYIIETKAIDADENTSELSEAVKFTVDTIAPDTQIDTKPPENTNSTKATFAFSSNEEGVTYWCSLDGVPYAVCSSGEEYTVGEDSHSFRVKAVDRAGNEDSDPATYTWTVDTTPPTTLIDTKPPEETNSTTATFTFSSGGDRVTYECSLDLAPYAACTSGVTYTVEAGLHSIRVLARDAAGNLESTPATYSWTVDLVAPDTRLHDTPPTLSNSNEAQFTYSSTDASVVKFLCSLDDGPFTECPAEGMTYPGLLEGSHSFSVQAMDKAGNGSPVRYNWIVDTIAPVVLDLKPLNGEMVGTPTPVITGRLENDPLSTVRIYLDGESAGETLVGPSGLWSFKSLKSLGNGSHTVSAVATDPAGNTGPPSATHTFIVDTEPPDTVIVEGPPDPHNSKLAAFVFESPSGATEFEYQLDDASTFTACGAELLLTGLVNGHHKLRVRAKDSAGNVDPEPSLYEWDVLVEPPPFPELLEPADGAVVNTGTPSIAGVAVANGSVIVYINDKKSGVALADGSGRWSFRPPTALEDGVHSLTAETMDVAGNTSEHRSPVRSFTVLLTGEQLRAIGGGLSCAASGTHSSLSMLGWGGLLLLAARLRYRP